MVIRRMAMIALLLCFCFCLAPFHASAISTADATELIDPSAPCELTISYRYNAIAFSGVEVKLYRVAEVSANFIYTLTNDFKGSNLVINGIKTQGEWNVIRSTLETYIVANNVSVYKTVTTDSAGQASFENIKAGLYLAVSGHASKVDLSCYFEPVLISMPTLAENGIWQYQAEVTPKPKVIPPITPDEEPIEIEYKVIKLWKDDEEKASRPTSIEVEIYRNEKSMETVVLSEENNWSYSWTANDDGASWIAAERNIPSGYTATYEARGNTFVLTNSLIPDLPDDPDNPDEPVIPDDPISPPTGDTSNVLLYILLMNLSGILLIILGVLGKKKRV